MKKSNVVIGIALGVVFLIIAAVYWLTPAGSLPAFMPGFLAGSSTIHIKHGLLAFILAALSFVYAWFAGGKRTSA